MPEGEASWRECIRILPMLGVMAGIFYFSHLPGDALELPPVLAADKILHALAYGILAATAIHAVKARHFKLKTQHIWRSALAISVLYGISDEIHQYFIPGRFMSGWDILADAAGALVTVLIWRRYHRPRQSSSG